MTCRFIKNVPKVKHFDAIKVQVAKKLKDKRQKRTMEEIFKKVTNLCNGCTFVSKIKKCFVDWISKEISFSLQES